MECHVISRWTYLVDMEKGGAWKWIIESHQWVGESWFHENEQAHWENAWSTDSLGWDSGDLWTVQDREASSKTKHNKGRRTIRKEWGQKKKKQSKKSLKKQRIDSMMLNATYWVIIVRVHNFKPSLHARYCSNCFGCISSLNPHNSLLK